MTALPQDPATALPGWMDLPDGLSAADYEALPEDIMTVAEPVTVTIDLSTLPLADGTTAASRTPR